MKLEGKGVIVTGAGSGIGQAVARLFASEGAEVVTVGRTPQKLERRKLAPTRSAGGCIPTPPT